MTFLVGFSIGATLVVLVTNYKYTPNYTIASPPIHTQATESTNEPKIECPTIPPKITYEPFDPDHNASVHIPLIGNEDRVNFWKKYTKYHNDMFNSDTKRFVLWTKSTGWGLGNNINGLITAILLGLLTDRAILVDDSYVMERLLEWPINWKWQRVAHLLPNMPPTPDYFQNGDCFWLNDQTRGAKTQFNDLEEMFPGDQIRFETNCPAFHWMAQNEKYIPKLRELGAIPENMPAKYNSFYTATWISNMFFKNINATIQNSLNKFIEDFHFRDSYVIGVQLRFGNDGQSFIQDHEVHGAVNCAQRLAEGKTNARFFIATNSDFAVQVFVDKFGAANVSHVKGVVESFDVQQVSEGMEKIFWDNYLLSEADELIITPMSTFGSVAAFRGGVLPMVVRDEGCYPAKMERGPGGRPPTWDTLILW